MSILTVLVLCGKSPRHIYVANKICEAAEPVAIVVALPEDDADSLPLALPLSLAETLESSFVASVVPAQAARKLTETISSKKDLSPFRMAYLLLGLWAVLWRVAILVVNSRNEMAMFTLVHIDGFTLMAAGTATKPVP